MGFIHGKSIFVMLNGKNITGYLNKIECPGNVDTAETSTFGLDDKTFIPGMRTATLSAEGLFDGSLNAIDQQMNTILAGENVASHITWFPSGNVLGSIGYGLQTIKTAYSVTGTKDDAVRMNLAAQSNIGRERIKLIKVLSTVIVSGTSSITDDLAPTSLGGSAFLQAVTSDATTSFKIEHSSDNFVADVEDLVEFTDVAPGTWHERIVITGTIKRYVRVVHTLSNLSGSVFAVALHRN